MENFTLVSDGSIEESILWSVSENHEKPAEALEAYQLWLNSF